MNLRVAVIFLFMCLAFTVVFAEGIEWNTSLDDAAKKAKEENKLLFVYFSGPD